jgi:molybdopterin-guanine dinucleotide biosynthesis protein A
MPFVPSTLLLALRSMGESGASAVVPQENVGGLTSPLCAYYGPEALATCERLIEQGERRAMALLEALPAARTLSGAELSGFGSPARLLLSIDTPDDLAAVGGQLP